MGVQGLSKTPRHLLALEKSSIIQFASPSEVIAEQTKIPALNDCSFLTAVKGAIVQRGIGIDVDGTQSGERTSLDLSVTDEAANLTFNLSVLSSLVRQAAFDTLCRYKSKSEFNQPEISVSQST